MVEYYSKICIHHVKYFLSCSAYILGIQYYTGRLCTFLPLLGVWGFFEDCVAQIFETLLFMLFSSRYIIFVIKWYNISPLLGCSIYKRLLYRLSALLSLSLFLFAFTSQPRNFMLFFRSLKICKIKTRVFRILINPPLQDPYSHFYLSSKDNFCFTHRKQNILDTP